MYNYNSLSRVLMVTMKRFKKSIKVTTLALGFCLSGMNINACASENVEEKNVTVTTKEKNIGEELRENLKNPKPDLTNNTKYTPTKNYPPRDSHLGLSKGPLPKNIQSKTQLTELHLSDINLSQNDQKEISMLVGLKELCMMNCGLDELHQDICNLTNLEHLSVRRNHLKDLPSDIVKLKNLKELHVGSMAISVKLQMSISRLTGLKQLHMLSGKLTKLLPDIGNMTSLEELTLNNNDIQDLPTEFSKLKNLKKLYISHNKNVSVNIIETIGKLQSLEELDMMSCNLTELHQDIGNLKNLWILNLSYNELKELPSTFYNLVNMKRLDLKNNKLESISTDIDKLNNLETLYLQHNEIKELPSIIKYLVKNDLTFDKGIRFR